MTEENREVLAFNRGVISSKGLARIDLDRMAMSGEQQSNWMPRVLGSMMLRPGMEFIDNSANNVKARQIPFTFGADDTAQIELTNNLLRVRIDDALISRPSVSTSVSDGNFDSLTNWQDEDEGGAVSTNKNDATHGWVLSLIGTGEQAARRTQNLGITVPDQNVEHALNIVVARGTVTLRVGSSEFDDDFLSSQELGQGEHSVAFTPTSTPAWIELSSFTEHEVLVKSIAIATNDAMSLATPWAEADLPNLRWDQSGDVIYVACRGVRQMKIERRALGRSWSVVQYFPLNGPFRVQNTSATTLTPSAINGEITLTASKAVFKPEHATYGALFRVASGGQTVTDTYSGGGGLPVFTNPIRVTGSEDGRLFSIIIEGTFSATVTVQFSIGSSTGPWNDLSPDYSSATNTTYNDGQDGSIIYYRIGIKSGDYTSGTVTFTLTYTGGSIEGIARVNTYTSSTSVGCSVIEPFGAITASKDWWEGEWSERRGYPTSVAIHEGRLSWAGLDKIWLSESDSYESFNDREDSDAAPISRTIGSGPHRVINWLLSMGRLLLGTSDNSQDVAAVKFDGNSPLGCRSNTFDEPLTRSNFNIKSVSSKGMFVDRTGQRLYELTYNLDEQDYKSLDLSIFAPDFNDAGIVQVAVQMKPDIRVHCVRSDGTVGVLVFDRLENVICWCDVETPGASGFVEDVSVLPGLVEDQVYYFVRRTINGASQRHLCKWALESEAVGGQLNKMADSFVTYEGAATLTPFTTELLHLRDETVVVWADGIDLGTDVVTSTGGLTTGLSTAASNVVVGLAYRARFKGTKLGRLDGIGLLEKKRVNRLGFIAENMHYQGLKYGPDFDNLSDLPKVARGQVQSDNHIYESYHEDDFPFGGTWDPDSRICLEANAPRPCTILAALAELESVTKSTSRR